MPFYAFAIQASKTVSAVNNENQRYSIIARQ